MRQEARRLVPHAQEAVVRRAPERDLTVARVHNLREHGERVKKILFDTT